MAGRYIGWLCFAAIIFVGAAAMPLTMESSRSRIYIVQMGYHEASNLFASKTSWYGSVLESVKLQALEGAQILEGVSAVGPEGLMHVYDTVFHGFSAKLTPQEASYMESMPGVLSLYPDGVKQLHTTRTPEFLGLSTTNGLWPESDYGEDVIIGVLDTGVWPESSSFSDNDMGPVPERWRGICESGTAFSSSACNKKLIGARFFCQGYEAASGPMNESLEYRSPRDSEGHGTHTSSTAGGRDVANASLLGYAEGTARGMAPLARIAVYKICWEVGCYDSDILAAFDRAVADGVDIISLSVGGAVVPYSIDSIAIGSFGASKKGIFVSCSAGNKGPGPFTVSNIAPWIMTVGASTLDRAFPANVLLNDGTTVHGVSLYSGPGIGNEPLPLIYSADAGKEDDSGLNTRESARVCLAGSLDPNLVSGKVVLCERGSNARVEKGAAVLAAGGAGMILANTEIDGEGLIADSHVLPATSVGNNGGQVILSYIRTVKDPKVTIEFEGTVLNVKPAPVVASFSSRGPNSETPQILKPDVVGPGVNILAAWTGAAGPTGLAFDTRRVNFNLISGTSMSCPHISGIGALLRAAHPDWSPAAIKSALMTTASRFDNWKGILYDEATGNVSSPFDFGAGAVQPQKANNPGLVYDIVTRDYVNLLCALKYTPKQIQVLNIETVVCPSTAILPNNFNYPSFAAIFEATALVPQSATFIRTVTNVGLPNSTYTFSTLSPEGVTITVEPEVLVFTALHEKQTFTLHVEVKWQGELSPHERDTKFAYLTWTDGIHDVQSPVAITRNRSF
jgi:subtilisin family serine protease